jgi:hypothetical protein
LLCFFSHHVRREFKSHSWQGVLDTTLCEKVCQWFTAGGWFSLGTPFSSTNKTVTGYNWNIDESGVKHHNPNPFATSLELLLLQYPSISTSYGCLRSVCCSQWCLFLWIVNYLLLHMFSLTFIVFLLYRITSWPYIQFYLLFWW